MGSRRGLHRPPMLRGECLHSWVPHKRLHILLRELADEAVVHSQVAVISESASGTVERVAAPPVYQR